MTPIIVDGSAGEGGGQVLRTSLALSLATGKPLQLEKIRAKRRRGGLRPQHLASVRLAARIGAAEVEGDEEGSKRLTFAPQGVFPGTYDVDVGTAGSATLVLQTVLPPLLTASGPTTLRVTGGTYNPWAPPYDFLERVYLPAIRRLGPEVQTELLRPGFAPAGGGRIAVDVRPASHLATLELNDRGPIHSRRAEALLANLPRHVGERELGVVQKRLGWPDDELHVRELKGVAGAGNALLLEVGFEHGSELVFEPGKQGLPAETVAQRAVTSIFEWLDADVPVGEHLADQLLLPLALGSGGVFRTLPLSSHARTQIELIQRFLDVDVEVQESLGRSVQVTVTPRQDLERRDLAG